MFELKVFHRKASSFPSEIRKYSKGFSPAYIWQSSAFIAPALYHGADLTVLVYRRASQQQKNPLAFDHSLMSQLSIVPQIEPSTFSEALNSI